MRTIRRLTPAVLSESTPATAADAHEMTGLAQQREQAVRGLEQTRGQRESREIERAGEVTVKELEIALTGPPEPSRDGVLTARVVATGDKRANLPAVPLGGLAVRLKVKEVVVAEARSNAFGLVSLDLPREEQEGRYDLEVLGPDCAVLACVTDRWDPQKQAPVHHVELARTEALQPQLEAARPFEEAIQSARERAALARQVAVKALQAQEIRLVAYLAEIDAAMECLPDAGRETRTPAVNPAVIETPPPATPDSAATASKGTPDAATPDTGTPSEAEKRKQRRRRNQSKSKGES